MFLIREIFTRDATKWWFRAIVIAISVQAVAGSLVISVECPRAHILYGKFNDQCVGNVCRPSNMNVNDFDGPPKPLHEIWLLKT